MFFCFCGSSKYRIVKKLIFCFGGDNLADFQYMVLKSPYEEHAEARISGMDEYRRDQG